jgi:hypothetical protein
MFGSTLDEILFGNSQGQNGNVVCAPCLPGKHLKPVAKSFLAP